MIVLVLRLFFAHGRPPSLIIYEAKPAPQWCRATSLSLAYAGGRSDSHQYAQDETKRTPGKRSWTRRAEVYQQKQGTTPCGLQSIQASRVASTAEIVRLPGRVHLAGPQRSQNFQMQRIPESETFSLPESRSLQNEETATAFAIPPGGGLPEWSNLSMRGFWKIEPSGTPSGRFNHPGQRLPQVHFQGADASPEGSRSCWGQCSGRINFLVRVDAWRV